MQDQVFLHKLCTIIIDYMALKPILHWLSDDTKFQWMMSDRPDRTKPSAICSKFLLRFLDIMHWKLDEKETTLKIVSLLVDDQAERLIQYLASIDT